MSIESPLINIGYPAWVQAQAPLEHPTRLYQGQHQRSHPQTGENISHRIRRRTDNNLKKMAEINIARRNTKMASHEYYLTAKDTKPINKSIDKLWTEETSSKVTPWPVPAIGSLNTRYVLLQRRNIVNPYQPLKCCEIDWCLATFSCNNGNHSCQLYLS